MVAFGKVGKGFIDRAGAASDDLKSKADKAASSSEMAGKAAKDTGDALDKVGGGLAANTTKLSDFGAALDRIGAAFQGAKDKIFSAIALALTPALEAFAAVLESPAFQKFVDMLAEQMYDIFVKISDWLINEGIPAFESWLEDVNEAGGIVEWVAEKWNEFKDRLRRTFLQLLGIIVGQLLLWRRSFDNTMNNIRIAVSDAAGKIGEKFEEMKAKIGGVVEEARATVEGVFTTLRDRLGTIFDEIGAALTRPFTELRKAAEGVFKSIGEWVDGLPGWLKKFLSGPMTLPSAPDNSENTPQSLTPGASATAAGGAIFNIYVTAPQSSDPRDFGGVIADATLREMRRRGIRIPALA
jgi:phage-related protein